MTDTVNRAVPYRAVLYQHKSGQAYHQDHSPSAKGANREKVANAIRTAIPTAGGIIAF